MSSQKPGEDMGPRSVVWQYQGSTMTSDEVNKAWDLLSRLYESTRNNRKPGDVIDEDDVLETSQHLSSLHLSSVNDIEPGKTIPLSEDVNQFEFGEAKQGVTRNNGFHAQNINKSMVCQVQGKRVENVEVEKASQLLSSLHLSYMNDIEPGKTFPLSDVKQFEFGEAKQGMTRQGSSYSSNNDFHAQNINKSTYGDVIEEDDFLKNIDADEIVMDHHQYLSPGFSYDCTHNRPEAA